jgi:transketolase
LALNWAVNENPESTYIRLVTIPVELNYRLPTYYVLTKGCGVKIWGSPEDENNVAIIAYGPVMLREAVKVAAQGEVIKADVFNFPWLNRVEAHWATEILSQYDLVVVLDDHYKLLGLGSTIATTLGTNRASWEPSPDLLLLGLEKIPACGQNSEVLEYHGLNAESIATRIKRIL